jgi:cell division protein FtsB
MAKKKNILSRIISNSKFLTFVGLAVIILMSFPIARNISQRHRVDEEIRDLQKEIVMIENKNTELRKLIDYLDSDQYVEEQARLNFGLKKQGEDVIVIDIDGNVNKPNSQDLESGTPDNKQEKRFTEPIFNIPGLNKIQTPKPISNPQRWWRYFFGG